MGDNMNPGERLLSDLLLVGAAVCGFIGCSLITGGLHRRPAGPAGAAYVAVLAMLAIPLLAVVLLVWWVAL